jgi:hypothetical protein
VVVWIIDPNQIITNALNTKGLIPDLQTIRGPSNTSFSDFDFSLKMATNTEPINETSHAEIPLYGYPAGTFGPKDAVDLIEGLNLSWSNNY